MHPVVPIISRGATEDESDGGSKSGQGRGVYNIGDTFVGASSGADTLLVNAVKRRNGGFGLLLINEDLASDISVTVSVNGYNYASKGVRYDYGKSTIEAGKGVSEEPMENLGPTFTVQVPRYSMTAIAIPKAE
jgi:hypothetical protein